MDFMTPPNATELDKAIRWALANCNTPDELRHLDKPALATLVQRVPELIEQCDQLQREVAAWRDRFPRMEYRRMDDLIDLKFSEFQKQ